MQTEPLATSNAHLNLQPFKAIQVMHALVVDHPTLTPEQNIGALIAESGTRHRDLAYPTPQHQLLRRSALAVERRTVHQCQPEILCLGYMDPRGDFPAPSWLQSFFCIPPSGACPRSGRPPASSAGRAPRVADAAREPRSGPTLRTNRTSPRQYRTAGTFTGVPCSASFSVYVTCSPVNLERFIRPLLLLRADSEANLVQF